jgi:hypothetical protein
MNDLQGLEFVVKAVLLMLTVMVIVGVWAMDRLLALGKPKPGPTGPTGPQGWIGPPGINGKNADVARIAELETQVEQAHAKIDSLVRLLAGERS